MPKEPRHLRKRPDNLRRPYNPSSVSTGSPRPKTVTIKKEHDTVSTDLSAISTTDTESRITSAHIKAETDSWRDLSRRLKPEDLKTENTGFRFEPPLTADSSVFHELPGSDAKSRQSLLEDKKVGAPTNPEAFWYDGDIYSGDIQLLKNDDDVYSECDQWGPCRRKDTCQQFAPCQQFAVKKRLEARQESAKRGQ